MATEFDGGAACGVSAGGADGGRWQGKMPGVIRLAGELGVVRDSVEGALRELEREGVLRAQGPGCGRLIDLKSADHSASALRTAIMGYDPPSKNEGWVIDLLHQTSEAGHIAFFTPKTLIELGMDLRRISRMARETAADAWTVGAGTAAKSWNGLPRRTPRLLPC